MELKKGDVDSGISKNKRGQVTIFIIIGILILFTVAGVLYVTRSHIGTSLVTEEEPYIADVPQEFKPLQAFTENCLSQISKRGLLILGQQGGYIYPDIVGEYSTANPTEASGINLEPSKVPYWYYNQEPNQGNTIVFASLKPKLYAKEDPSLSIEAQLARFVNEKLDGCLDDYNAFIPEGFQLTVGPQETDVKVAENTVHVFLTMNVEASKGESRQTLERFLVKIPLPLKRYYDLADSITQSEQNYSFLEKQGLDLIQVYSDVDAKKLPPTLGTGYELIPTIYWATFQVKEKVQQMLTSNVPLLRLASSNNFYRYEYPVSDLSGLYQRTYDTMALPIFGSDNINVNFDYFDWEPYFDVNDQGGTIKPGGISRQEQRFSFSMQEYNTLYDISYPVLVTIEDKNAFGGEGYRFVFALESNIRNNAPAENRQVLPAPIAAFSPSSICEKERFNTQLLQTIVVDSFTREPLKEVQIGLSIPQQDNCQMGTTDEHGKLESKYPAVYGGILSFTKEGYLTDFYPVDTYTYKDQPAIIGYATAVMNTNQGKQEQPVFEMHPYRTINVTVKKRSLEKCVGDTCFFSSLLNSGASGMEVYAYQPQSVYKRHRWIYTGVTKDLLPEETAVVTLNRIGDINGKVQNQPFSAGVSLAGDVPQEMELVPGIYEVTGILTLNAEVAIPKEKRCPSFDECMNKADEFLIDVGSKALKCKVQSETMCADLDQVVADQFIEGQLQWDEPKYYMTITPEQLYNSPTLEMYIPSANILNVPFQEHLRIIEDLQIMGQGGNISKILRPRLEPKFK